MGNSLGRAGRRRRVLNEEMVAASATHATHNVANTATPRPASGPPYGEAARLENQARVIDLVPRRWQTMWLGLTLGALAVAALTALDHYHDLIAQALELPRLPMLQIDAAGSLASWMSSVAMLLAATYCALIYSLRRHKLSDYRGRYRIWRWATAACVLLSANDVCNLRETSLQFVAALNRRIGFAEYAVWTLTPLVLLLAWIAIQTVRDLWESRLARAAAIIGTTSTALFVAFQALGADSLRIQPDVAPLAAHALLLSSKLLLLCTTASYARFVILAADGTLAKRSGATPTAVVESPPPQLSASESPRHVDSDGRAPQPARPKVERSQTPTEWIDGSSPETFPEHGEEDQSRRSRKSSKSERKRLRKLKAQRRAA